MKHGSLYRTLSLLLALALSLTACGSKSTADTSLGSFGKLDAPKQDDPTEFHAAEIPGTITSPEESAPFAFSEVAQAALDDLCAHGQQEYMAAAFLGEREQGDTTPFSAWLHDTTPDLASIWPFLEEIPEENIFGEYGDLYCIVPLLESANVTLKGVQWETLGNGMQPHYSEPVYYGEVGKPFLMYIKNNDIWTYEPDLVIEYVRQDGFAATWFPEHEAGSIFRPVENGHDCVIDFSLLYDVGDYIPYFHDGLEGDNQWLPPTDLGLGNTSWCSRNGWVLQLGYDENAEGNSGGMVLYESVLDAFEISLTRYCHGVWWMESDNLYLDAYNDWGEMVGGSFPVRISPSGEQLVVMQADDGSQPPFFEPWQTTVTLTLSYG